MRLRDLLTILVGLLVFVCVVSFLVWLRSSTGPQPESGMKSLLAPQEAYACIQPPTFTRTPTRTLTRTITPTPTSIPAGNKFVDGQFTGGNQDGNSWENAYRDISTAITNVATNGVIYVAEGTYTGNYNVNKSVSIFGGFRVNRSATPDTAKRDPAHFMTQIRASNYGQYTITISSSNITLDGFWISPVANQTGPSLYCSGYTSLKVRKCWFAQVPSSTLSGGGAYLSGASEILFEDCTFRRVRVSQVAGAAYVVLSGTGNKFERCIFDGNSSTSQGGGLYCSATALEFINCLFSNNSASTQGSALYLAGTGTYTLNHCTVTKNGTSGGSAVAVYQASSLSTLALRNSIIHSNLIGNLTCSNGSSNYCCIGTTQVLPGTGNMNTDPLFYRPEFDWHLRPDSPCLNAADPNSYQTVQQDLAGYSRDNYFGARFDMGCYEWPDPRFFGVVEQVLPSPYGFRQLPGFEADVPQPFFMVPERIDEYVSALDDLGIKSIEIFIPWAKIEVLPGQNTGTLENPLFEDPVYLWDDNGNYNEADIGAVTENDWTLEIQNPYDQWDGMGDAPDWPKSNLEEDLLSTTYHKTANLGYIKVYLEQWADYMQNFMNTLHEHGIEIAAAIEQAPAWRVTTDPSFPYANALDILGCNDTPLRKLRWFTTLFFNKYMQGALMNDAAADYPGIQQFAAYFEKQFPFVDLYTAWQEVELNFPRETPQITATPSSVPTPAIEDYRHEECWEILKAIKTGLSTNTDNTLYINVFEAFSDNMNNYGVPLSKVHLDYIHGLIDQAGNDIPVGAGTPTPLPIDKVRKFRDTVKIIGINIAHGIGGEDSVVGMSPNNTAERGSNRLNYSFSYKYGDPGYEVNMLDQFEVWNQQNSVYRGCNKERGPWRFEPLIDQMDNPDDQQWAAQTTYKTSVNYLYHPGITRSRYTYTIDVHLKKPIDWCDEGLFDYHFSTKDQSNDIAGNAYATSWIHPLTGIHGGEGGFDYYFGDILTHYPAYYALKCFRRNLNQPSVPKITSFSVPNGYGGDCIVYGQTPISVVVNFSEYVFGETSLLIDGIVVSSYEATSLTNQITYQNISLAPFGDDEPTLSVESKYHRMSVKLQDRFAGPSTYHSGTIGDLETGYRFITIINPPNDYAPTGNGNGHYPIQEWDFTEVPFPTETPLGNPTSTNTRTRTPTPTGPTPTLTEENPPYFTPTRMSRYWNRRSYVGYAGVTTPTIAPTLYIGWSSNEVVMKGGGACGVCNYDRPAHNGPCCNNYNSLTQLPPCWQGTPTPPMPTQGIFITPTPTGSCTFNNHECNPICSLNNFEGGEMWKQISTVGYYDVVVEMTIKASGMSYIPHGMKEWGNKIYKNMTGTVYQNDDYRPYQICRYPLYFGDCPDASLIEEVLMVMFTMNYDSPYGPNNSPSFIDSQGGPGGIQNWTVAKMIPRSVLMSDYGGLGKILHLDFSTWNQTDDNENFGLWIRCQLDSQDNQITIDDIKVYGKRIKR